MDFPVLFWASFWLVIRHARVHSLEPSRQKGGNVSVGQWARDRSESMAGTEKRSRVRDRIADLNNWPREWKVVLVVKEMHNSLIAWTGHELGCLIEKRHRQWDQ